MSNLEVGWLYEHISIPAESYRLVTCAKNLTQAYYG